MVNYIRVVTRDFNSFYQIWNATSSCVLFALRNNPFYVPYFKNMMPNCYEHIAWMDLELTGLDVEADTIIEIASIITDKDLNIISEEFNVVIHQPDRILENMNEWCIDHHNKTGLTNDSKASNITIKHAEEMLLNFLKKYIPEKACPLAGNSIYMDRLFLRKYMFAANEYMHYRVIDVSTIKELTKRWNPEIYRNVPEKSRNHRALADIKESIEELKYYKQHVFNF